MKVQVLKFASSRALTKIGNDMKFKLEQDVKIGDTVIFVPYGSGVTNVTVGKVDYVWGNVYDHPPLLNIMTTDNTRPTVHHSVPHKSSVVGAQDGNYWIGLA